MGSSSAAVTGVLAVACGILFTLPRVYCDEFTDENRPYEFGFNIEGQQHRHEKKDENGIIKGEFGFITADGIYHVTVYATDENGNFKILSMKNIRVSPPLDGSAPYNPSLQGITGSGQQTSRIPASGLVPSQAPVTVVTSRSTAAQPVTPAVKVYTGCSGCKIPVKTSTQALENYPTEYPQSPSGLSNPYTTHSSILTQNVYPNTYPGTNAPGFQAAGGKGRTPVKISDDYVPPTINNVAPSFPGSGKVPSTYKFPAVPEIIKPTVSPLQPTDNQGFQPSRSPPYLNGQYQTSPPSTIPSNQGQKPNPVLGFEEIHPSPGIGPINEQKFKGLSTPTSVTISNKYFPSTVKGSVYTPNLTKPLGDQINNSVVPPTLQQQNNSFLQFGTSLAGVEKDGLPPGITEDDIKAILYKFNYTVGFHGHYESGYRNGDKLGGYFFNGRDGFGRNVQYTANEFGYQPNITLVELGLDSKDTPKEETEKQFGLTGYEFKWFYRK